MTITIYTIKGVFDGKFFTIFNISVGFHPSTTIAVLPSNSLECHCD